MQTGQWRCGVALLGGLAGLSGCVGGLGGPAWPSGFRWLSWKHYLAGIAAVKVHLGRHVYREPCDG